MPKKNTTCYIITKLVVLPGSGPGKSPKSSGALCPDHFITDWSQSATGPTTSSA